MAKNTKRSNNGCVILPTTNSLNLRGFTTLLICAAAEEEEEEEDLPKEELKMANSWLTALENLQAQFRGLPDVEKLMEKDFEWVDEVLVEATALFKKDSSSTNHENDKDKTNDESTSSDAPVLLPQTPRVKKDRAERLRNNSTMNRRSSIRVVTGTLATKRASRKASQMATQKIAMTVENLSNIGKKLRRPTLINGTVSFASNSAVEEEMDEDEETKEVNNKILPEVCL